MPALGNPLAIAMLLAWPLVCLALFRTQPTGRALIWSLLGGYLLLPPLTAFDLPLIPALDKSTIPAVTVLMIVLFALKERPRLWPRARAAQWLMVGLILCVIPSVLTNADPLIFEILPGHEPIRFITRVIPGLSLRDLGSVVAFQVLALVPFLLARHYLASEAGLKEILIALTLGGLIYSLPALFEILNGPTLNIWIYGFFQHDFAQMVRDGGYRPIVFLPHGLWLALFFVGALLACATLARVATPSERPRLVFFTLYLLVVLYLSKSLASQLYGLALLPAVLLLSPRWQVRLALGFALVAVTYPMLRNGHLIPLDWILEKAGAISADRQHSLAYRFENEELLLARAAEKPFFGWGGWGRNLVRDFDFGVVSTIPDGRWIIIFGTFGWLGYLCEFGLLSLPLLLLWRSLGRGGPLSPYAGVLCVILGVTMIDMLLNDTLTPVVWMISGAILGHAEARRAHAPAPEPAESARTRTLLEPTPLRGTGGGRTVL